jgi:hypothetical protein
MSYSTSVQKVLRQPQAGAVAHGKGSRTNILAKIPTRKGNKQQQTDMLTTP